MIERKIKIINKLGLHARAAAKLVKLASSFESKIEISRQDPDQSKTVNGKSIMGVMMLAASKETEIILLAEGPDEETALTEIEALIADRFGEGE